MIVNNNLDNESEIYRVLHVIPYDGIGGVEIAAKSMGSVRQGRIDFSLNFIFQNIECRKDVWRTFNVLKIISAARIISNFNADVIVVSLWRSSIVGLIAKLLNKEVKLITFLHSTQNEHFLDYFFTKMSMRFSDAVWVDSVGTMLTRVPLKYQARCRVISFVTCRLKPSAMAQVHPAFIFWGRLTENKGITRAINIFAGIYRLNQKAIFWIIGPDGGALAELKALRLSLGLEDAVFFMGQATHDEIVQYASSASFYLQTSEYEGMAMSVVESMQLGLVPVVTPVGEIGSYCIDGKNAVMVKADQQAVDDVMTILEDEARYKILRNNAIATWADCLLYRDSVLAACEALV